MKHEDAQATIQDHVSSMPVIDAHEHLEPECQRVSRRVDFFLLFSHYSRCDLVSAGMPRDVYNRLRDDESMSPEEKWDLFSPFYSSVRHGSFAEPGSIWLHEILGFDDITRRNFSDISARLQEWNIPGLYDRVLRKMCHIECALVPGDFKEYNSDLLRPIWPLLKYVTESSLRDFLHGAGGQDGKAIGVGDYLDRMEDDFRRYGAAVGIGMKGVCFRYDKPDFKLADSIFRSLSTAPRDCQLSLRDRLAIAAVVYDRGLRLAEEYGIPVAMHSGVWGDFRNSQPTHLIPLAQNYPGVSFDLFHLGMPYVRESVMIGKMFPNVSLNFCWNAVFSGQMMIRMLDECIDMVPVNKIIAFGGDYRLPVEKVYGHLKMSKQIIAEVLAKRVAKGKMDISEALRLAEMWFYHNPCRIYGLRRQA